MIKQEIQQEIGFTFPEHTCFEKRAGDLKIVSENGKLTVYYEKDSQLARAALLIKAHGGDGDFCVEDKRILKDLCFMVDCSRNGVLSVPTVKKFIRNLSMLGYNCMMLYTEETYQIESEPIFGYLRGRYTTAEMKEIDEYAKAWGIEMIPCIQTLAHLRALRRWYTDFEHLFDCDDILMVGDEKVYEFIEKMFQTMSQCYSSRRLHIGMDEAHNVGRGLYMDKNGYRDTFDILSEHLEKVAEIGAKYGYSLMMWSDMFLNIANRQKRRVDKEGNALIPQDVIDRVPANVSLCHWDYAGFPSKNYLHRYRMHMDFKNPVWMSVSSYKVHGFAPSNAYSEYEMKTAFAACKKYGINQMINCSWGDGGAEASMFSILPSIVNVSGHAHSKTRTQMKKEFLALTGYTYDAFMKLEWPDNGCGKYTKDIVKTTKVMMYNDLLTGQFDTEVDKEYTPCFERSAKALMRVAKGQYDYIFKNMATLSRAMHVKYELGIRLREAYAAGDKEKMREVTKDIDKAVQRIAAFIKTLKKQWMTELKPYGFEIQEYRLGGVMERMKGCKERVLAYVNGEVENIPELEETLYPDAWLGRNPRTGRQQFNSFELIASVNRF